MGINPIWYSLRLKTSDQIKNELADADVIWVNGGNTFYLLEVARKVGFLDIVNNLVRNKGVIYGGTSAGSILATPSVEIAGWGDDADDNKSRISNFSALNFVNLFTQVHYDPSAHREMLLSKKMSLPIYAIPDGAAIEVIDEETRVHGQVEII